MAQSCLREEDLDVRHEDPEAVCRRKRQYTSKAGAVIEKRRMGKDELWVYQCTVCTGWHLGHPNVKMIMGRLRDNAHP